MDEIYQRFGNQVRRARKAKGLTQEQLAARLDGLGRTSVVSIEKGDQRVYLHTLVAIAGALGVEPAALLPVAPTAEPEILAKAGAMPAPELDWVLRVTRGGAPDITRRETSKREKAEQGRTGSNRSTRGPGVRP